MWFYIWISESGNHSTFKLPVHKDITCPCLCDSCSSFPHTADYQQQSIAAENLNLLEEMFGGVWRRWTGLELDLQGGLKLFQQMRPQIF